MKQVLCNAGKVAACTPGSPEKEGGSYQYMKETNQEELGRGSPGVFFAESPCVAGQLSEHIFKMFQLYHHLICYLFLHYDKIR
jgi:hypothetical protein